MCGWAYPQGALRPDPPRVPTRSRLEAFQRSVEDRGQEICSFSCHGNPLHPNPAIARSAHQDFVAPCQIASHLGVRNICMLAGTPGGGPGDETPNWIINSAWPMFANAYRWQWEERIIPYWKDAAKIADQYAVKLCIEPHTGDAVYNTQTFLRLREAVGPTVGMNFDPSHLWWQGIDPIVLVETVGEAIYSVHVKDVLVDERLLERDGIASSAPYDDWNSRPWKYCTIGYGHSELFWRDLIIALRRVGYDGPLEHRVRRALPDDRRFTGQVGTAPEERNADEPTAYPELDGRLPARRLRPKTLGKRLPRVTLLDSSQLIRLVQMVKTWEEIRRMRMAASIAEKAMPAGLSKGRAGRTAGDVRAPFLTGVARSDALFEHWAFSPVGFGQSDDRSYRFAEGERPLHHR